jgi:ligand-binding sensor domain-containing protein
VQQKLLILFLVFLYVNPVFTQQNNNLVFTHLTTRDGLSGNIINFITQDSSGFIWIGTTDGLDRYDGRHFKIYRSDPLHSNSIPDNSISSIAIDKYGIIWAGTNDGLCSIDPVTDSVSVYKNIEGNVSSLSHNYQPTPFIDHDNNLWIGTRMGLDHFNRNTKTFTHYSILPKEKNSGLWIRKIAEDKYHRFWCAGITNIYLFDPVQKKFSELADKAGAASFYDLLPANDTSFFVAEWNRGLAEFNPITKIIRPKLPGKFPDIILSILQCRINKTKMLIAGSDRGMVVFSPDDQSFSFLKHDEAKPTSIAGNRINCLFADRQQIVWIGTQNGISQLNQQMQLFINPLAEKKIPENIADDFGEPGALAETEKGYLIGVMYYKGLYQFDKNWNFTGQVQSIPVHSSSKSSASIYHIWPEGKFTWFSTDSGLVKLNNETGASRVFLPQPENNEPNSERLIRKVVPYESDLFFVRTWHDGVYLFDKTKEKFIRHFRHEEKNLHSLPDDNVLDLVKNIRNEIYVTTAQGLCLFNPAIPGFEIFRPNPPSAGISNFLGKMTDDSRGDLWITSPQGLFWFDTQKKQFKCYTTADGMATNKIQRVCIDKKNRVWFTSLSGLSMFDPVKSYFYNFSVQEGLPTNYFEGIFTNLRNGRLLAAYNGGIVLVDPDKAPFNAEIPPVKISEVHILDKPYAWSVNANNEKTIWLNHQQNVINISFAVLNFTSPYQNKFFYKLKGFDKDWRQSADGNIAYTSLSPGEYTLQVKGANNSAVMNETGDVLHIIIMPAFWQTWWFVPLCLALIVLATYWLMKRRIRSVRHQAALKQKIAETETMALRTQMNPHFIFNCINSIDNLIQTDQKEKATEYLAKFAKLIRAILENSKNDVIPCWKDLETLQLYIDLEAFRWDKPFTCHIQVDEKIIQGDYKVPPMVIQPFVENAIQHGLLNKIDADKQLFIKVLSENGSIKYIVQDNGVGRKQADEYKKLNKPSHQSLGVQITTERINLYNQHRNGSVKIFDLYNNENEPAGTRVEVELTNQA